MIRPPILRKILYIPLCGENKMLVAQEQSLGFKGSAGDGGSTKLGGMTLDSLHLGIPGIAHIHFHCDLLIRDRMNLRHTQGFGERLRDSQCV